MEKAFNIIFTGGGSGGHVMPAVALINKLIKKDSFIISYIGSKTGIEKEIITSMNVPYFAISSGKLRRYFSFENFVDLVKVLKGIIDAFFLLMKYPKSKSLVFSTGGFVSVPVVIAAFFTRKTIFIHEQTSRIGLANKISSFFANKIFVSFNESIKYFPKDRTCFSGYPLRSEIFSKEIKNFNIEGIDLKEIKKNRKILFITGGGNGAKLINDFVKNNLNEMLSQFFVVHQVGKRFETEYAKLASENYLPVKFVDNILDIYKLSDIIISRAGAATVSELIELNKRSIFIPLAIAQKNEQFCNAKEAEKSLGSLIISEEKFKTLRFNTLLNIYELSYPENIDLEKKKINAVNFIYDNILNNFNL